MATVEIVGIVVSAVMAYTFVAGVTYVFAPEPKNAGESPRSLVAWSWPVVIVGLALYYAFGWLFRIPTKIADRRHNRLSESIPQARVVK